MQVLVEGKVLFTFFPCLQPGQMWLSGIWIRPGRPFVYFPILCSTSLDGCANLQWYVSKSGWNICLAALMEGLVPI